MRNSSNAGLRLAILCVLVAALPLAATAQKADPAVAKQVLELAGVKSGLCIHLGCGRETSASLTADLAAAGMAVHAIALDDASLARARKAIEAQGMSGRALADKADMNPLPYLRDMADVVVIEDFDALAAKGLKMDEVMRVAAPGGAVCTLKDGKWAKAVKPRPAEMDEWTHPNHGPDGNMVSQDKVVHFPLGLRWIDGLPMNVNQWASCRAWVTAGGRLFTLTSNVLENINSQKKKPLYLCAQDAWNGLPLWKVNCETTDDGAALNSVNFGTLVTDGKRVYTVVKDQLIGFDAATGAKSVTFAAKHPAVRLALLDGVLIASCWEAKGASKAPCDQGSLWGVWVPKDDVGTVEAFDAATGAAKWSLPNPAQQIIVADGSVYLMVQKGNPPTERTVLALDLATGKERWKAAHTRFGDAVDIQLNTAGKGYLIISKRGDAQGLGAPKPAPDAKPKLRAIYGLASADGKELWQISPAKSYWTPVVDGMMWYQSKKHDVMTGQEKGNIGWGVGDQFCTPMTIVNNYLVRARGGQFVHLPEGTSPSQDLKYGGARGACIEGMVPANGMFYTAQNNCQCMPGQVYGFVAIGPVGDSPAPADFEKARDVEKGPAFGQAESGGAIDDNAWATYRGDAERSASSKCELPAKFKELWRAPSAKPAEGPLAEAWKMRLGSCLSAPTIAGGMTFVAAVDAGQVIAIDAASGKPVWKVALGGRIDTPPTFFKGLCLVGSHDGWLYALRAKDGELAWRVRVAPWDRRMVAYGQVESVWPAVGTVLVHDGVAYANAGRTSESDGGIAVVAVDPATGAPVWAKPIATGTRMNDMLVIRDGNIAWYNNRMDPKTGQPKPAATFPKDPSQGGMLDGTWTAFKFRRPGNGFTIGKVTDNVLAWNDKLIVSRTAAVAREGEANVWATPMPKSQQVEAIALAANAAVFAGRTADADGKMIGFLAVLSSTDGKPIAEIKLPAPPAYDGLAIANGRIYVSLQDGSVVCFGKAD